MQTHNAGNYGPQITGDVPPWFQGDRPAFLQVDLSGQGPEYPGYPMERSNEGEPAYTPVQVDTADLFSKRDLNSDPDLSGAITITAENNSEYTIREAGIYILTGHAANFTVKVEAGKTDKVQIVLKNASIANDDFPVIYVKAADCCYVTSIGDNNLSVYENVIPDGETNTDAVIFSEDDLSLNGTGSLTILSVVGNGITCKDDMKIAGGKYEITCELDGIEVNDSVSVFDGTFRITAGQDALHCENDQQGSVYIRNGSFTITAGDDGIRATTTLVIDGGEFNIIAAEGLEATYVQINDGTIRIEASDDGINAAGKSNALDVVIEINGGEIEVVASPGDTDGLDANGVIAVNGGVINVTGNSAFDADRGSIYNGGTILINGVETNSIPYSMMPGHGGMGRRGDRPQGEQDNRFQYW